MVEGDRSSHGARAVEGGDWECIDAKGCVSEAAERRLYTYEVSICPLCGVPEHKYLHDRVCIQKRNKMKYIYPILR
jgi:hypothetical protein